MVLEVFSNLIDSVISQHWQERGHIWPGWGEAEVRIQGGLQCCVPRFAICPHYINLSVIYTHTRVYKTLPVGAFPCLGSLESGAGEALDLRQGRAGAKEGASSSPFSSLRGGALGWGRSLVWPQAGTVVLSLPETGSAVDTNSAAGTGKRVEHRRDGGGIREDNARPRAVGGLGHWGCASTQSKRLWTSALKGQGSRRFCRRAEQYMECLMKGEGVKLAGQWFFRVCCVPLKSELSGKLHNCSDMQTTFPFEKGKWCLRWMEDV